MDKLSPALYIHIPFCSSICSYCDFPKLLSDSKLEEKYIDRLICEIKTLPVKVFHTVYIGGGTPTCLSDELLEKLLSCLKSELTIQEEFSIEANPESLLESKAKILSKYGVNRVSLGIQSFDDEVLHLLNRKHDLTKVEEAISCLLENGLTNYNLDFIYGLKSEKREDLDFDVKTAFRLKASHLSFYALQIEKGTPLYLKKDISKNDDEMADDYDYLVGLLEKNGFYRYEVSNFALKGKESKHNLTYWKADDYYALGLGATSYVQGLRQTRTKNIFNYIQGKDVIASSLTETLKEQEFDFIMLNLRLEEGFKLEEFTRRFKKDFLVEYKDNLTKVEDYLLIDSSHVKVKKEDIYILDSILVDLLHF